MSLKLLAPAAAMLLTGAVMTTTAQAAPAPGLPEALANGQASTGVVEKAHWRHHHRRHHHHHHRRHHHHHHHHR